MSERKTEYSDIIVKVIGTKLNKDGNAVRFTHPVDNLPDLIDQYWNSITSFEDSVVDVPPSSSKRHQKIGLRDVQVTKDKGVTFYHLALDYLARESGPINTRNLKKNYKPRTIKLEDGEYECATLCCTIVPAQSKILLDSKCYNAATGYFLKQLLLRHLDHGHFGLGKSELEGGLRVTISATLMNNYQDLLAKKFNSLSELSFTVTKPSAKATNVSKELDIKEANKQVMGVIKNTLAAFMTEDEVKATFQDLPLKRLKFVFSFDDSSDKKELNALKKAAKSKIPEIVKSEYVTGSVLAFKNEDEEEMQKAFLRGIVRSEPNRLPKKDFAKCDKMWAEQRRVYWKMVSE